MIEARERSNVRRLRLTERVCENLGLLLKFSTPAPFHKILPFDCDISLRLSQASDTAQNWPRHWSRSEKGIIDKNAVLKEQTHVKADCLSVSLHKLVDDATLVHLGKAVVISPSLHHSKLAATVHSTADLDELRLLHLSDVDLCSSQL